MKLVNISKIVGVGTIALMMVGCGNNTPQPQENISNNKVLQNTKGTRIATISLHRESSMLGAALNMEAFLNGQKVSQKLYNNDTVVNKIKHNGTVVIQVENEVRKIKNVKNGVTIICSTSSVMGSGSEFMKNAFMLNGFSPKLAVELKCNKK